MSHYIDLNAVPIVSEDIRMPSGTPGIELHVRNKRPAALESYSPERTIVMVHGATFSSGSLYDVPLGGFSFMDYLASAGFDVFALDVRGYGHSSRPAEMALPPEDHAPLGDTATGVADLGAVIDHVLALRQLDAVSVFGMSWGGTVAAAYTASHNEKVRRLALLAPQWLSSQPIPIDTGGELGAYRLVPVRDAEARWRSAAPEDKRADLIPEGWFTQWADATLAEDDWSSTRTPGRMRAGNGPIEDIRTYWRAGVKYYDPSAIVVPTLLVHAEWDIDVPIDLAKAFFAELRNAPDRRWIEIGEGTHMVLLEKQRMVAFEAIRDFYRHET